MSAGRPLRCLVLWPGAARMEQLERAARETGGLEVRAAFGWAAAARTLRRGGGDALLYFADSGRAVPEDFWRRSEGAAVVVLVPKREESVCTPPGAGVRVFRYDGEGAETPSARDLGRLRPLLEESRRTAGVVRPSRRDIVLLGASTGGPQAVATVLEGLERPLPASVGLAQHMPEDFVLDFGRWLGERTGLEVRFVEGVTPFGAGVFLPVPGRHLVVGRGGFDVSRANASDAHVPSVDVLFESAVPASSRVVAVLLTGMGRDGARGLLRLRQAGAATAAQDAATSAVFGMPKEAVRLGAAEAVLPAGRISAWIDALLGPRSPAAGRGGSP